MPAWLLRCLQELACKSQHTDLCRSSHFHSSALLLLWRGIFCETFYISRMLWAILCDSTVMNMTSRCYTIYFSCQHSFLWFKRILPVFCLRIAWLLRLLDRTASNFGICCLHRLSLGCLSFSSRRSLSILFGFDEVQFSSLWN